MPSAVTLLSRLFARQYNLTGVRFSDLDLGMDLRVAGALKGKVGTDPEARVHIGRMWVPPASALLAEYEELIAEGDRLAVAAESRNEERAIAKVKLDDTVSALAAVRSRRQELSKVAKPDAAESTDSSTWKTAWDHATEEETRLRDELVTISADHASAVSKSDKLNALQLDLDDFIATSLTATAQDDAPMISAVRGEWLDADKRRVLVYVKALSGGADELHRNQGRCGPARCACRMHG